MNKIEWRILRTALRKAEIKENHNKIIPSSCPCTNRIYIDNSSSLKGKTSKSNAKHQHFHQKLYLRPIFHPCKTGMQGIIIYRKFLCKLKAEVQQN